MHFHSSLLSILLIVISCPLTVRTRRVAPLIEEDWARRPHRAAGKSPFQSFNFNSFFFHIAYIFDQSINWKHKKNSKYFDVNIGYCCIGMFPFDIFICCDFIYVQFFSFKGQGMLENTKFSRNSRTIFCHIYVMKESCEKKRESNSSRFFHQLMLHNEFIIIFSSRLYFDQY